ncbi:hypothetical protein [Paenisporosarcina indica]|uniref:hypothetical protein n=1 Tax=Paenisporosarcina indica TaxID=650093 RepID=UPI00094FC1F4|nr:hypothetical protein [Paenisporosarcina indica]
MSKKTSLVVALSALLLVGCGDEEANRANNPPAEETQDETQVPGPKDNENEGVSEDSEVKPGQKENEIIGDDEFDMPDTQEKKETDLNK